MSVARSERVTQPDPVEQVVVPRAPYPPSFVDRFTAFIQRLPLPYGLTYLLLFTVQSVFTHVLSWLDGWLTAYEFSPILLLFPFWLWVPLAIITYLDEVSLKALAEFAPLLEITPESKQRLEYEFTVMPTKPVVISGIVWSAIHVLFWVLSYDSSVQLYGFSQRYLWMAVAMGAITFSVGSVIYYHSIRQLRLVDRIVQLVDQFDLFRREPVYALSVLTSRTGVAWMVLLTLTLLITPMEAAPIPVLTSLVLQVAFAMAAFVLPLRVVNRRLVSEKRRLLAELDQRLKATLARLHEYIDNDAVEEAARLEGVLKGLTAEREILTRIPTWPWRPGLFTGFVSIVVLPIVLFLVQVALGRWLGR